MSPSVARTALVKGHRWSVQTPTVSPALRTDVYLCGDMVHQVAEAVLQLSEADRASLFLRHWARLADLETDWDRLDRWHDLLVALQPYAAGAGIASTGTLIGHAVMTEGAEVVGPWLAAFGVHISGWVLAWVLTGARWLFRAWLERRMKRAVRQAFG